MPREFSRHQRVSEVIRREMADIIRQQVNLPGLGMLTVSAVEVTADLKSARIYVTLLGGNLEITEVMDYLNHSVKRLRHQLAQRLTLRLTPQLHFVHDTTIEEGSRLLALINTLNEPHRD